MDEFRFAQTWILMMLLPLGLLLFWRWQRSRYRLPAVIQYSDTRLLSGLPRGLRVRLRRLPDSLLSVALVLLLFVAARPQLGEVLVTTRGDGIDIVLALDISRSMIVPDLPPNRLEATKALLSSFVASRSSDRIGLVVFGPEAFYRVPLTLDYNILLEAVQNTSFAFELGLGEQTAIGMGIATATNLLRNSDAASRIILLITDGTNNTGAIDPITAAEAARAFGIRIYTVGIGTNAEIPITAPDGRVMLIQGDLDEATLQRVANISGGRYYPARTPDRWEQLTQDLSNLERSPFESQILVRWRDIPEPWLVLALLCLILERFMRHTFFQTIP